MKKSICVVGLVLALIVGYVAAGPFLTLSAIKTGIVEQDLEKLSENIDFPTLRQNLKDQFDAATMKNIVPETKSNRLTALVTGFATRMVDGVADSVVDPVVDSIVDSVVTPNGLAALMGGKKLSRIENAVSSDKESLLKRARFAYDSTSKFSIWVSNDKGKETRFILHRKGLSWKLVNLVIPIP